jgi:hypothetical protein
LFEQASSRGHLQQSLNGLVSFPFTIRNQITTSFSTFEGALNLKDKLMQHQVDFGVETAELIDKDESAGYVISESKDVQRFQRLLDIFDQHNIGYYPITKSVTVDGKSFPSSHTFFVPLDQPQYRLIKSMFSTRKRFNDNTFYDVSNWNLLLSFNINFASVGKSIARLANLQDRNPDIETPVTNALSGDAYAFAFAWKHMQSPTLLNQLLANGIKVKVANRPFVAKTTNGDVAFEAGSVVIPLGLPQPQNILHIVEQASTKTNVKIWNVESGLTGQGIDFGSRNMIALDPVKVLLVGGSGTSQYEVGEIWHYFDQRLSMPSSIVEVDRLSRIEFADYSHIVMAQGNYSSLSETVKDDLKTWLNKGGVLIGQKTATRWFTENGWLKTKFLKGSEINQTFKTEDLRYGDQEALQGRMRVAGAVFESKIDLTHPLAFGYFSDALPLFRNSNLVMLPAEIPFVNVAMYDEKPLMAGYASDEIEGLIANSAAIVAHNVGRGKIIGFVDDLNFRGYWYGTSRLMANAIFMSPLINAGG